MNYREMLTNILRRECNSIADINIINELKSLIPEYDISKEIYDNTIAKLQDIEYNYLLNNFGFREYQEDNLPSRLSIIIRVYLANIKKIAVKDDSYKIYPITINKDEALLCYNNNLSEILFEHLQTNKPFDNLLQEKIAKYTSLNDKVKDQLLNGKMVPYYGNIPYLINRINSILTNASKITSIEAFSEKLAFINNINIKPLSRYENAYCGPDVNSFKNIYDEVEKIYLETLEFEKSLLPIVEERWNEYLTDPKNHNPEHFAYIAHGFTQGSVDPEKMTKACCTLATSKVITIPYGSTWGILYPFDKDAVESVCPDDAGSWAIDKNTFVDREFPVSWQLTNPEGQSIFYEVDTITRIELPEELEEKVIEINKNFNGEILNYDKGYCISEIVYIKPPMPNGVFYTDDCKNIDEVQEYANRYKLPVVHISLEEQRKLFTEENLESKR